MEHERNLEPLIEWILGEIVFAGDDGVSVAELLALIDKFSETEIKRRASDADRDHAEVVIARVQGDDGSPSDLSVSDVFKAEVWDHLRARPDVLVGEDRTGNTLSLQQVLGLPLVSDTQQTLLHPSLEISNSVGKAPEQRPLDASDLMAVSSLSGSNSQAVEGILNIVPGSQYIPPAVELARSSESSTDGEIIDSTRTPSTILQNTLLRNTDPQPAGEDPNDYGPQQTASEITGPGIQPRIYVSEDRMWKVITGHGVNFEKIPKPEWQLLCCIAAAGPSGIMQPDLHKATGQDKRTAPRLTDFLFQKGYIDKRQIRVQALTIPTSLLILNKFKNRTTPANLTPDVIMRDSEPLPGHEEWTGVLIDTELFAVVIVAVVKAWGEIGLDHLQEKMGIGTQTWHHKIFRSTVQDLVGLGVFEKSVLGLPSDHSDTYCLKPARDLTESDRKNFQRRPTSLNPKKKKRKIGPRKVRTSALSKKAKRADSELPSEQGIESAEDDIEGTPSDNEDPPGRQNSAIIQNSDVDGMESWKGYINTLEESSPIGKTEEPSHAQTQPLDSEQLITAPTGHVDTSKTPQPTSNLQSSGFSAITIKRRGRPPKSALLNDSITATSGASSSPGLFSRRHNLDAEETSEKSPRPRGRPPKSPVIFLSYNDYALEEGIPGVYINPTRLLGQERPKAFRRSHLLAVFKSSRLKDLDWMKLQPKRIIAVNEVKKEGNWESTYPHIAAADPTTTALNGYTSPVLTQNVLEVASNDVSLSRPTQMLIEHIETPTSRYSSQNPPAPLATNTMPTSTPNDNTKTHTVFPSMEATQGHVPLSSTPDASISVSVDASKPLSISSSIEIPVTFASDHNPDASLQFASTESLTKSFPASDPENAAATEINTAEAVQILGSRLPTKSRYQSPYQSSPVQILQSTSHSTTPTFKAPASYKSPYGPQPPPEPVRAQYRSPYAPLTPSNLNPQYQSPYSTASTFGSKTSNGETVLQVLPVGSNQGGSVGDLQRNLSYVEKPKAEVLAARESAMEKPSEESAAVAKVAADKAAADELATTKLYEMIRNAATKELSHVSCRMACSKDGVAGNLYLSAEKTTVGFRASEDETDSSTLILPVVSLSSAPVVTVAGSRPMELQIVIKEIDETTEYKFRFLEDDTALQAANKFRAKLVTAMTILQLDDSETSTEPSTPVMIDRPFSCETCTLTWRNKEGIIYHRTKSKTTCNPNWVPPQTPLPVEAKSKKMLKSKKLNAIKEAAKKSIVSQKSLLNVLEEDVQHEANSEVDNEEGTVSMEYEVSLSAMTPDDTSVPGESSQAPESTTSHTGRARWPKPKPLGPDNESITVGNSLSTTPARKKLVVQASYGDTQRYKEMIMSLLKANSDVFPGEQSLWFALVASWLRQFPNTTFPDRKSCDNAVRLLEDDGSVRIFTFSWKNVVGIMATHDIITRSGMHMFDEKVMSLKDLIKDVYPDTYVPEAFAPSAELQAKLGERGTRLREIDNTALISKTAPPDSSKFEDNIENLNARLQGTFQTNIDSELATDVYSDDDWIENIPMGDDSDDEDFSEGGSSRRRSTLGRGTSRGGTRKSPAGKWRTDKEVGWTEHNREQSSTIMRKYWEEVKATGKKTLVTREELGPADLANNQYYESGDLDTEESYIPESLHLINGSEAIREPFMALWHGRWQPAANIFQNPSTGAWNHGLPQGKRRRRRSNASAETVEPLTFMQSRNDSAWNFRPFGHGVKPIYLRRANKIPIETMDESNQSISLDKEFRPVIMPYANSGSFPLGLTSKLIDHQHPNSFATGRRGRKRKIPLNTDSLVFPLPKRKYTRRVPSSQPQISKSGKESSDVSESESDSPSRSAATTGKRRNSRVPKASSEAQYIQLGLSNSNSSISSLFPQQSAMAQGRRYNFFHDFAFNDPLQLASLKRGYKDLIFLAPNTKLYSDPIDGNEISFETSQDRISSWLPQEFPYHPTSSSMNESELSKSYVVSFQEITFLSGKNGVWSALSQESFETGSFSMHGWFPSATYILENNLPRQVEDIYSSSWKSDRDLQPEEPSRSYYGQFLSQVDEVAKWEQVTAMNVLGIGTVAPNYVFFNHTIPSLQRTEEPQSVQYQWLSNTSFTPETLPYDEIIRNPETPPMLQPLLRVHNEGHQQAKRRRRDIMKKSTRISQPRVRNRVVDESVVLTKKRRQIALHTDLDGLLPIITREPDLAVEIDFDDNPQMRRKRRALAERTTAGHTDNRLMVACVVIRTLTGGLDRLIDWTLVAKLFQGQTQHALKDRWTILSKKHRAMCDKLAFDFQDIFLAAYEQDELPAIDYDHLLDYNWGSLVDWILEKMEAFDMTQLIPRLPVSHNLLNEMYELKLEEKSYVWQDDWFGQNQAVYKRLDGANSIGYSVPVSNRPSHPEELEDLAVAKSWVRASTLTPGATYNTQATGQKMAIFGKSTMNAAVKELANSKVIIQKLGGRAGPGRGYEISDQFSSALRAQIKEAHFLRAIAFKRTLDAKFRAGEKVFQNWIADDGEILAVTNLQAYGRVKFVGHNIPMNKFGLTDGNYQTRQMDKNRLLFDIEILPTESYVYDEDLEILMKLNDVTLRPPVGPRHALPAWYDIAEQLIPVIWSKVLTAVVTMMALRTGITIEDMVRVFSPSLEGWELKVLIEWAIKIGLMDEIKPGSGIQGWHVGEWWWLVLGKTVEGL